MKTFLAGPCRPENVFSLVDPSSFLEIDFEAHVVRALTCLKPKYFCGVFAGTFVLDGEVRKSDLALVAKDFSHWLVVEVELTSHSLNDHVLPQVRCLRYGDPRDSCIASLCGAVSGISEAEAARILKDLPRDVVVVCNSFDHVWDLQFRGLGVQHLVVSVFADPSGQFGYQLDGVLSVIRESIGFAKYSAQDRSLQLPLSCRLPVGAIQIEDPFGVPATWIARATAKNLWLTREHGTPGLIHDSYVQILRTIDGRLSLRQSST